MKRGIVSIVKRREAQKEYYQKHSEKIKLRKKKWREEHPEYHKQYRMEHTEQEKIRARKWALNNPDKAKLIERKNRLKKYGITVEIYDEMFKNQNGVCAICLKPELMKCKGTTRGLSVDHNHTTGEVRQLLCDNCNKAIGLLKDSSLLAQNVMNYLIKWN